MTLAIQSETPPLSQDADGAVRIGESRVLLELVIRAFQDGATPEAIIQRYSTLALGDVYAVVAYYLRHRTEIDQYLSEREKLAHQVRTQIANNRPDISQIRDRINARRNAG